MEEGFLNRFFKGRKVPPAKYSDQEREKVFAAAMVVAERYGNLLSKGGAFVRESSELPFSKPTIKAALEMLIIAAQDEPMKRDLRASYVSLSCFQSMNFEERASSNKWDEMLVESARQDADALAAVIVEAGEAAFSVQARMNLEMTALRAELEAKGLA